MNKLQLERLIDVLTDIRDVIRERPELMKDLDRLTEKIKVDVVYPQSDAIKAESFLLKTARSFAKLSVYKRLQLRMVKRVAEESYLLPLVALKKKAIDCPEFDGDVSKFIKCVHSLIKSGLFSIVDTKYATNELKHLRGVLLVIHESSK